METVTADSVLLVPLVGERIDVRLFRHGLMKGGIEDGDVGDIRENRLRCLDPGDVGGIVERRQVRDLLDSLQHALVDPHGAGEFLATVHDPVADRGNLVDVLEDTDFGVEEGLGDQIHRHRMVRAVEFLSVLLTAGNLVNDEGPADGDTLHQPLGDYLLLFPVE